MHSPGRLVGAILIALVAAGCAGGGAIPQGDYGMIVGSVRSTSGVAIQGAVVSTAAGTLTTVTQADGSYKLDTVPADSATTSTLVSCSAAGYITQNLSTHVTTNQSATLNFTLSPG